MASGSNRALRSSAAEIGRSGARVALERQPDICGDQHRLLSESEIVGQSMAAVVKRYEKMITGTINPRIRECFLFNQSVYEGLRGR